VAAVVAVVDGVMGRLGWVAVCGMMGVGNHSCWAVSGRMLFLSDQTPCPLLLLLAGRNPEGEYLGIPQPSCQPTLASLPPSLAPSLPFPRVAASAHFFFLRRKRWQPAHKRPTANGAATEFCRRRPTLIAQRVSCIKVGCRMTIGIGPVGC